MNNRTNTLRLFIAVLIFTAISRSSFAQNEGPAVGQWRSLFSYNQATGVATDQLTFFCGTTAGFFTYNRQDGSLNAYSKATGMHDVGIAVVAHDIGTEYTLIGYENSNIDLFRDGAFYNVPDLMLSTILGDKRINDAEANKGFVYLATGIGLVTVNLEKKEIKETIPFFREGISATVNAVTFIGNDIYVATSVGSFKTSITNPGIQNYLTWEPLNDISFDELKASGTNLYAADSNKVYSVNTTTGAATLVYTSSLDIKNLSKGTGSGIWVLQTADEFANGKGVLISKEGALSDSFRCFYPTQLCQTDDGAVWFSDQYALPDFGGLRKKTGYSESQNLTPVGPPVNSFFDVYANDGELWVAHGSIDRSWRPLFNYYMFSHYRNGTWKNYNPEVNALKVPFLSDVTRVYKDNVSGSFLFSAVFGGVLELKPDGQLINYKEGALEATIGDANDYKAAGVVMDDKRNMWVANYGAPYELKVRSADGQWYKYHVDGNNGRAAADILIDDYGQKWFIAPGGGGAVVFDDGGTLNNTSDDRSRVLRTGENNGNLPDNATFCIAKDRDGAIWIGTNSGIGIVNCPGDVISRQCESSLKVVQYEGQTSANYLFKDIAVRAIAVDGANRKWIGTSNGVWLISADAEDIIYRFTAENSPLPSNEIYRINIDPVTGDVYFSTDKGLVAFRSTATEGTAANSDPLLIYPNPVPSGFSGTIAIRGVAENADVRITDISGQLVYRTNALGGQAVWSGLDYTGHRVQTGVYLVFVTNKDGTQKTTGKLIFNE